MKRISRIVIPALAIALPLALGACGGSSPASGPVRHNSSIKVVPHALTPTTTAPTTPNDTPTIAPNQELGAPAVFPNSGTPAGGTSVTIDGTNLSGATAVYFGTTAGTITSDSAGNDGV